MHISPISKFTKHIALASVMGLGTYAAPSMAATSSIDTAIQTYESGAYVRANKMLNQLIEQHYANLEANFYLGLSASRLNKREEAIAAFERVLIMDPTHTRSKLELGKLYYELKSYADARYYFESALRDKPPKPVVKNVNRYLSKINRKYPKHHWDFIAMFGLGYDTNSNSAPVADNWYLPELQVEVDNTSKKKGSFFHQEVGIISHTYHLMDTKGFNVNNRLTLLNRDYTDYSEANVIYVAYNPGVSFKLKDNIINVNAHLDHLNLDGHGFLNSYGIVPSISRSLSPNQQVGGKLRWLQKLYRPNAYHKRNASNVQLSGHYNHLFDHGLNLTVGSAFETESADANGTQNVDYNRFALHARVAKNMAKQWQISGLAGFKQTAYEDKQALWGKARNDHTYTLAVEATKPYNKQISFIGRLESLTNNSNIGPYEYDKNIISFNVMARF